MGWADLYIKQLTERHTVTFRAYGRSMEPLIMSGQEVTVAPLSPAPYEDQLMLYDVVLCQVKGRQYLHKILEMDRGYYLIGNNRGGVNGWIGPRGIFGIRIR